MQPAGLAQDLAAAAAVAGQVAALGRIDPANVQPEQMLVDPEPETPKTLPSHAEGEELLRVTTELQAAADRANHAEFERDALEHALEDARRMGCDVESRLMAVEERHTTMTAAMDKARAGWVS